MRLGRFGWMLGTGPCEYYLPTYLLDEATGRTWFGLALDRLQKDSQIWEIQAPGVLAGKARGEGLGVR